MVKFTFVTFDETPATKWYYGVSSNIYRAHFFQTTENSAHKIVADLHHARGLFSTKVSRPQVYQHHQIPKRNLRIMFEKAVGPQTPLFSTAAASPKKQKFHFHDSAVTLHFKKLQIPLEIKKLRVNH